MAALYNRGKKKLLDSTLDLGAQTIKALLVNSGYAFNPDHNVVSDVVANEVSGAGYSRLTLAGKAITQNNTNDRAEFDANDLAYTGLNVGAVGGIVLFVDPGTGDANCELLAFIDSGGFPVTTNGGNVTVQWSANGILHLV